MRTSSPAAAARTAGAAGGGDGTAAAEAAEAHRRVSIFMAALMSSDSFDKHTLQVGWPHIQGLFRLLLFCCLAVPLCRQCAILLLPLTATDFDVLCCAMQRQLVVAVCVRHAVGQQQPRKVCTALPPFPSTWPLLFDMLCCDVCMGCLGHVC